MTTLFNAFTGDLALALGLAIAAIGVILLTRIGMLPKKSLPYALLAIGGAFGLAWFKKRQADGLRQRLEEEKKRLEELEREAERRKARLDASGARLDAARAAFDARSTAVTESIVELDANHRAELARIANLSGEALDAEMTALLSRLPKER